MCENYLPYHLGAVACASLTDNLPSSEILILLERLRHLLVLLDITRKLALGLLDNIITFSLYLNTSINLRLHMTFTC